MSDAGAQRCASASTSRAASARVPMSDPSHCASASSAAGRWAGKRAAALGRPSGRLLRRRARRGASSRRCGARVCRLVTSFLSSTSTSSWSRRRTTHSRRSLPRRSKPARMSWSRSPAARRPNRAGCRRGRCRGRPARPGRLQPSVPPAIARAVDEARSGRFGDVMFVRARYGHGGRLGYEREWRARREISGGGELVDQGMHLLDLCYWLLGPLPLHSALLRTNFWDVRSRTTRRSSSATATSRMRPGRPST